MKPECIPIAELPHTTRLYRDYIAMGSDSAGVGAGRFYGAAGASASSAEPFWDRWMHAAVPLVDASRLAAVLRQQATAFAASPATQANIDRLASGARAVVTGQQVGLLGGPLLTLLKAASAIASAARAEAASGIAHVPVFWLATEDHDLAEVDQVSFPNGKAVETLSLSLPSDGREVGGLLLGDGIEVVLDRVRELTGYASICDTLGACYRPGRTLGEAFACWMTALFAEHGLIVMDAAGREFHSIGSHVLRAAIERADELEAALLARTAELEQAGYHVQVLVKPNASNLFLIDEQTGERQPLRGSADGWRAGSRTHSTSELLDILAVSPERISPNALLRPVFQDAILPTAAYIGGPAEIAYFAQSAVLYERILHRITPILPRFSATLVEPKIAAIAAHHEVQLPDLFAARDSDGLTQRLGARAMPIEGKRRLAAVGNALDEELTALTGYMTSMDASLGRSADVAARKMRYQMNRLRLMSAAFEVQKEKSLRKHAEALCVHLYPNGHLQERVLAGVWFLAGSGENLIQRLVSEAANRCPGNLILTL